MSPKLVAFRQVEYASELLFTLTITFTKVSILLFYRRIFFSNRTNGSFRLLLWIMLGINVFWGFSFFMVNLLQCIPISDVWDITVEFPTCVEDTMYYGMAISSVILDVLILIMPLPLIWRLQMSVQDKVAVSGIFLLGSLYATHPQTL